jgi:hypothetical protein
VAVLVFSLTVVGLARLNADHDRLLSKIEEWAFGDPLYYVVRPDDPMERLAGVPAALSVDPPPSPGPPPAPGNLTLTVVSLELVLDPPSASALTHVEEP